MCDFRRMDFLARSPPRRKRAHGTPARESGGEGVGESGRERAGPLVAGCCAGVEANPARSTHAADLDASHQQRGIGYQVRTNGCLGFARLPLACEVFGQHGNDSALTLQGMLCLARALMRGPALSCPDCGVGARRSAPSASWSAGSVGDNCRPAVRGLNGDAGGGRCNCPWVQRENSCRGGLRELNLGCCKLTDASIALLAGALLGSGVPAEGAGDDTQGAPAGHAALAGAGYGHGDGSARCLSTGGADGGCAGGLSARCEILRLHCNEMTAAGARHLAAVLPTCQLAVLDLSDNAISSAGAAGIGAALAASRPGLRRLYLGSNAIGDLGIRDIAAALPSAARLTHLELSDNRIVDEGATYLAMALALSPTLKYLGLASNQVGDQGASRIASALASARAQEGGGASLESEEGARGGGRNVGKSGTGWQEQPQGLEMLDVRGNRVGTEGGKRLIAGAPAGCHVLLRF